MKQKDDKLVRNVLLPASALFPARSQCPHGVGSKRAVGLQDIAEEQNMPDDVILARFRFGCLMLVTSSHFLFLLISYKLQMFYSVFGTPATQLSSPS